jgi:hypothetical protein
VALRKAQRGKPVAPPHILRSEWLNRLKCNGSLRHWGLNADDREEKMKKATLALLLFPLFALSLAQADWSPGENLMIPFSPSTDTWEASDKQQEGFHSRLWQRKGAGLDDSYAISVVTGLEIDLAAFRQIQDDPGTKHCKTFTSDTLDETPVNGYSRLMWRTRCRDKDGFLASMLQVVIQGHDNFYHVQKIWRRVEVPETEMTSWRERLASISVCDTRDSNRPCPGDHKPVDPTPSPTAGTLRKGTVASKTLIADAMMGVMAKVAILGCEKFDSYEPYIVTMPEGKPGSQVWRERWIVHCSNQTYPINLRFNESGMNAADWTVE